MAKGKIALPIEGIPVEMSGELSPEDIREMRGWDMESRRQASQNFRESAREISRRENEQQSRYGKEKANLRSQLEGKRPSHFVKGAVKRRMKDLDKGSRSTRQGAQVKLHQAATEALSNGRRVHRRRVSGN